MNHGSLDPGVLSNYPTPPRDDPQPPPSRASQPKQAHPPQYVPLGSSVHHRRRGAIAGLPCESQRQHLADLYDELYDHVGRPWTHPDAGKNFTDGSGYTHRGPGISGSSSDAHSEIESSYSSDCDMEEESPSENEGRYESPFGGDRTKEADGNSPSVNIAASYRFQKTISRVAAARNGRAGNAGSKDPETSNIVDKTSRSFKGSTEVTKLVHRTMRPHKQVQND